MALNAELTLLKEKIKLVKKSQLISDAGAFTGPAIAIFGFLNDSLIIGVLGAGLFALGFTGGTYFLWKYTKLTQKMALLAASGFVCPECRMRVPAENYAYCPFCGAPLKSWRLQPTR